MLFDFFLYDQYLEETSLCAAGLKVTAETALNNGASPVESSTLYINEYVWEEDKARASVFLLYIQ